MQLILHNIRCTPQKHTHFTLLLTSPFLNQKPRAAEPLVVDVVVDVVVDCVVPGTGP